jgi:hypothetical protein
MEDWQQGGSLSHADQPRRVSNVALSIDGEGRWCCRGPVVIASPEGEHGGSQVRALRCEVSPSDGRYSHQDNDGEYSRREYGF